MVCEISIEGKKLVQYQVWKSTKNGLINNRNYWKKYQPRGLNDNI